MLNSQRLKEKQRTLREGFPQNLALRVHRAISWLQRADLETTDDDVAFILLWISFNACYAEEESETSHSRQKAMFDTFFKKIIALDRDSKIYTALWTRFSGPLRVLLNNHFVFQPYWNHLNGIQGYEGWEISFERSKHAVQVALKNKDTLTILSILFDRLYVLRNQIIHGGATWNSSINRFQIRDGRNILAFLLPIVIDTMMNNDQEPWGKPYYPVVKE